MKRFRVFSVSVMVFVLVLLPSRDAAQQKSYPEKPITLLVPYGAEGNSDQMARGLAEAAKISQELASADSSTTSPDPYRSHVQTLNERKSRGILKCRPESRVWGNAALKNAQTLCKQGVLPLILSELTRNQ